MPRKTGKLKTRVKAHEAVELNGVSVRASRRCVLTFETPKKLALDKPRPKRK